MATIFVGDYGIPATTATPDTIDIYPDSQGIGGGNQLMAEFNRSALAD